MTILHDNLYTKRAVATCRGRNRYLSRAMSVKWVPPWPKERPPQKKHETMKKRPNSTTCLGTLLATLELLSSLLQKHLPRPKPRQKTLPLLPQAALHLVLQAALLPAHRPNLPAVHRVALLPAHRPNLPAVHRADPLPALPPNPQPTHQARPRPLRLNNLRFLRPNPRPPRHPRKKSRRMDP